MTNFVSRANACVFGVCGAVLGLGLSPAFAEGEAETRAHDFKTYQPSVRAVRIENSEAPKIDGDISDAVWAKAQVINEFYQLEPNEGRPSTEKSVVRVLYDQENIYVAFYAYDSEPDKINATIKAYDGELSKNDFVRVYLDPHMSRRDGYVFEVNPLGARTDAALQNNTGYLIEWNALWTAKTRIVADGWTVEYAIPFRSISYDPSRTDWGFDLSRFIRRKSERTRWSSIDNNRPSADISLSGTLQGVHDITQGLGLDIQAYGTARYKHEWNDPREDDVTFEPSGTLSYKITPALTGTLTFNTDFSDTALDERKVNTSRFGLFYPETRKFFLQDVQVFEFGGRTLDNNVNGQPFFSRNIGLVDGEQVDIIAGAKLSGDIGGFRVGGLTVATEGTETTDAQILTVGRVTTSPFEGAKVGFVFTNGDPTGHSENTVGGADFQYRNTSWFDGDSFTADAFYERSFSNVVADDDAFGVNLAYPNEKWFGHFMFKQIGEDYFPALGFVNRSGIRRYESDIGHRMLLNDGEFRWIEVGTWATYITGLDDVLQTSENGAWFGFMTADADLAFLNLFRTFENITAPFDLPRNVTVPAGKYTWSNASLHYETSPARSISLIGDIECCGFLDGDYFYSYLYVNWRPDTTFDLGPSFVYQDIRLPTGDVQIQIYALNVTVNFTPDMQLLTQAQYDNISEAFGMSMRYRWEFMPGSELFVSVGESAHIVGLDYYSSQTSQASVRIGHTARF